MSTLVLIAHRDGHIIGSSARLISAALQLGGEVDVLVIGHQMADCAREAAALAGVNKVLVADDARYAGDIAEPAAALLAEQAKPYTHVLASASCYGKDVLPRAAALLGVSQVSEIIEVIDEATFKRPVHAGSLIATVRVDAPKKVISVRSTAFEPVGEQPEAECVALEPYGETLGVQLEGEELNRSGRPELMGARVVVSGGRGVGSRENFALVEALADKLEAAVGASRAAVDAGYVPNDFQVGQTGKVVAPDLYIAVGISGAMQHLAGMQGAKVVVAINRDADAPIFANADYGLVGDLFELLPELTAKL